MSLLIAPLVSFFSTMLGLVFAIFQRQRPRDKVSSLIMGGCAGIMLGASFFSLIMPAMQPSAPGAVGGGGTYEVLSVMLGALLMYSIHELVPHEHQRKGEEGTKMVRPRAHHGVILMTLAVVLHNIPEGFALGLGSQMPDPQAVRSILWGIGLQNIPEGAIIAISIRSLGGSFMKAFWGVFWAACAEAASAALGAYAGTLSDVITKYALLFCAGAMIYVVSQEMIPESHGDGHEGIATIALILGLCFMMYLGV